MSDKINELKPGVSLSESDKKALADENAKATAEAHRMAAEARARDMENGGNPATLVNDVAGSIRNKLVNNDFQGTPTTEQ